MRISSWPRDELGERLRGVGVFLHTGPFLNHIRTNETAVVDGIALLYAHHRVEDRAPYADFHLALRRPRSLRRWFAPQIQFEFDGLLPFKPLPVGQALPMLEWGLNWCIGAHGHQFLIVHAAVVERRGLAAVLPGAPGSGKSTLTACLVHNGWRLLSDEMALLSLQDGRLTALARPISLKGRSIDLIQEVLPEAKLSRPSSDTVKGAVALLKPPAASVDRAAEAASPAWIVFPTYKSGVATEFTWRSKADTLIELARNAFNYSIHGARGFEALARLVDSCGCYRLTYSDLAEALALFDRLEAPAAASVGIRA